MDKKQVLDLVRRYYAAEHAARPFEPGKTRVHYSGRIFDENELVALVDASLDFWLTLGPNGKSFEKELAARIGVSHCLTVNSGSSANLLALSALCAPGFKGRLREGDEVITTAVNFPTTVAPILQNRLVPVFVDIDPRTYNIDSGQLEQAVSPRTRAIILAHTLGNPAPIGPVLELCRKHGLSFIEDNCDALDSLYDGRPTGSFGLLSTCSFYAAHHITMGEGGAVLTSDPDLYRILQSLRDWGRACWCQTGEAHPAGACRKRFDWNFEGLPPGYDHKYVYDHIGYNLKPLDLQCAIGLQQLKKLDGFTRRRRENFRALFDVFSRYEKYFILPVAQERSNPSWFALPLTVKPDAPFTRADFVGHLESRLIETRPIFAGNILRHPGFREIPCRIPGSLARSDAVLFNSFFLGVYPGIGPEQLAYIGKSVDEFFANGMPGKKNRN